MRSYISKMDLLFISTSIYQVWLTLPVQGQVPAHLGDAPEIPCLEASI